MKMSSTQVQCSVQPLSSFWPHHHRHAAAILITVSWALACPSIVLSAAVPWPRTPGVYLGAARQVAARAALRSLPHSSAPQAAPREPRTGYDALPPPRDVQANTETRLVTRDMTPPSFGGGRRRFLGSIFAHIFIMDLRTRGTVPFAQLPIIFAALFLICQIGALHFLSAFGPFGCTFVRSHLLIRGAGTSRGPVCAAPTACHIQ